MMAPLEVVAIAEAALALPRHALFDHYPVENTLRHAPLLNHIASRKICLCNSFKLHPSQRSLSMFSKTTTALPPPLKKAESSGRYKKRSRF
jgi:hypothetical protein